MYLISFDRQPASWTVSAVASRSGHGFPPVFEIEAGKPLVIGVVPTSSWGFAVMKSHSGERLFVEYEVIGNRYGRILDIQDDFKFKTEDIALKTLRRLNQMNRAPAQKP